MLSRSLLALALLIPCASVRAQDVPQAPAPDSGQASPPPQRGGAEFWIPMASLLIPGLGQYIHGAPWAGLGYTATAVAGVTLGADASSVPLSEGLPRDRRDQVEFEALHVGQTAAFLSSWDAFRRALPAQRSAGKYSFLDNDEDLGDLLTAPFDVRFLGRWTTWTHLAFTGLVTALVLENRNQGEPHPPLRGHDVAFGGALSLNAAVGEEAFFRGWLLPMFTQKMGGRFWLANSVQAAIFGGLHARQAEEFALVITGQALYYGWTTRRNDWSVREAIFAHFWYDAGVVLAELLRDDVDTVTLLPITVRF